MNLEYLNTENLASFVNGYVQLISQHLNNQSSFPQVNPNNLVDKKKKGLPQSWIDKHFKKTKYIVFKEEMSKKDSEKTETQEGNTCSLCFCDSQDEDDIRILPCGHYFHSMSECNIDIWLRNNLTCPLCRKEVLVNETDVKKLEQIHKIQYEYEMYKENEEIERNSQIALPSHSSAFVPQRQNLNPQSSIGVIHSSNPLNDGIYPPIYRVQFTDSQNLTPRVDHQSPQEEEEPHSHNQRQFSPPHFVPPSQHSHHQQSHYQGNKEDSYECNEHMCTKPKSTKKMVKDQSHKKKHKEKNTKEKKSKPQSKKQNETHSSVPPYYVSYQQPSYQMPYSMNSQPSLDQRYYPTQSNQFTSTYYPPPPSQPQSHPPSRPSSYYQ